MAFEPRLGHNARESGRVYAIVFDLDTTKLQEHGHNASYTDAYGEFERYLAARGFTWRQGSGYFGDETVKSVRCSRTVQKMAKRFSWFMPSVKDIRMLRIEENNDLKAALLEDDEDRAVSFHTLDCAQ